MTDADLLRLKGIGKARVAEIRKALEYTALYRLEEAGHCGRIII